LAGARYDRGMTETPDRALQRRLVQMAGELHRERVARLKAERELQTARAAIFRLLQQIAAMQPTKSENSPRLRIAV
jgi:hypothetical protein